VLLDDAVVARIGVDDAARLIGDGTFEGGIVPKLEAAVIAARNGVRARIGGTEVAA
jgi:acetylglutamate kinase